VGFQETESALKNYSKQGEAHETLASLSKSGNCLKETKQDDS